MGYLYRLISKASNYYFERSNEKYPRHNRRHFDDRTLKLIQILSRYLNFRHLNSRHTKTIQFSLLHQMLNVLLDKEISKCTGFRIFIVHYSLS